MYIKHVLILALKVPSLLLFFLIEYWGGGGGWSPYWVHSALRPLLAYCTCPGWLWGWRSWWNEWFWQGKPNYSEKTCPDATLSTTNPTCQTRAAAVETQRLTASAMARPFPTSSIRCQVLRYVQFSSASGHVLLRTTKYAPQFPVLKHPQLIFFLPCKYNQTCVNLL
jgi:hypothetical protein